MRQGWLHLHGVTDRAGADLPAGGTLLRCDTLWAVTSPWDENDGTEAEATAARVLAHHDILSVVSAKAALLPMRFGTVFSGERAVNAALSDRTELFSAALRRLDGIAEYALQLRVAEGDTEISEPAATGRAFLGQRRVLRDARLARDQRRNGFADEITAGLVQFDPLSVTVTRKAAQSHNTITILLETGRLSALRHWLAARKEAACALGLALDLTGPWPPYSFDIDTFAATGGRDVA